MALKNFDHDRDQVVLHTDGTVCATIRDLIGSDAFEKVVTLYIHTLREQNAPLIYALCPDVQKDEDPSRLIALLRVLAETPLEQVVKILPYSEHYLARREVLHQFVEGLYDFWRTFDRFIVCHSIYGPDSHDQRPYRTFNATVERLTHLIRAVYRDICENITGDHPRVYRQVRAGCNVGIIAVVKKWESPAEYHETLKGIPFVRQVLLYPPLIIDPPMNRRTGQFRKVADNPLTGLSLEKSKWLCYPAVVGPLIIFVYFHQCFMGLGSALANLFELATDEQIAAGPDAIYLYGAPSKPLSRFGDLPTVFYDDEPNRLLVAAVPGEDRFGYFGYLKKMILTLHNVVMMKRGRMPYHGAMTGITLKNGAAANVLLIGDTATGKSESLEAFRMLGKEHIRELRIIADDMGSLGIAQDGKVLGYGTEIGAFIRLDDLQPGYAFGQIDRAIIMSPQKVNARVVLPVTTLDEVLHGYPVEILLYANNYEEVDAEHPIIERLETVDRALRVLHEGAAMAKGTTTSTGLVHSYFANIFGPPQYKELHEKLAARTFEAAFKTGVFIAQMRTRLGIPGYEAKGPKEAAQALFTLISTRKSS